MDSRRSNRTPHGLAAPPRGLPQSVNSSSIRFRQIAVQGTHRPGRCDQLVAPGIREVLPWWSARLLSALLTALIVVPSFAVATEYTTRAVDVYGGLVTLDIPERWHEIPPDVLEFFSLQSAEESGGMVVEIYQHGFRPGNPEADFAPPQILIQIKESGRLSYNQFLDLPPIEVVREKGDERLDGRMGPLLENFRLNEVFFDRENYSIHIANTLDLKYEGKTMVTSVSFLTERGLLTLHCYALISQHIAMNPVFEGIIESVRIDESIRYRPRLRDRLPPRPALVSYAIALALAILALIIHLVGRRRRST